MVVRIQISFKTIKLRQRKEDLTVIELSETYKLKLKYKYWKEELEHCDNLREILLLLPRPSHSRQNGKP